MSIENNRKRRHNSNNSASGGASTPLSKKLNSGTGSVISDVKLTLVPEVNLMSETEEITDPVPKFKVLIMALRPPNSMFTGWQSKIYRI